MQQRVLEEVEARVQHRLATGRRPYHSAEVNRLARAARLRVCPETVTESRVRAFSSRRVVVHRTGNGMATLVADLADVDAHRIHRRLTAIAAGLAADAAADSASDRGAVTNSAPTSSGTCSSARHQPCLSWEGACPTSGRATGLPFLPTSLTLLRPPMLPAFLPAEEWCVLIPTSTSRSWSPWTPSCGLRTTQPRFGESARCLLTSPASSPPTGAGEPGSPTRPAPSRPPAPRAMCPAPRSPAWSAPASRTAASRGADNLPLDATSTTPYRGPAGPRQQPTSGRSADGTTT